MERSYFILSLLVEKGLSATTKRSALRFQQKATCEFCPHSATPLTYDPEHIKSLRNPSYSKITSLKR